MTDLFLSCDWGTTSFRLRLLDIATLQVLAEEKNGDGMAAIHQQWKASQLIETDRIDFYLQYLHRAVQAIERRVKRNLAGTVIVISGMASSTIGMLSLPYAMLPFSMEGEGLVYRQLQSSSAFPFPALLLSGVQSKDDIMRGEETQLIGCINEAKSRGRQLFIFPGTHSKHILVEDNQVVAFHTYMTGELFHLLSHYSILKQAVDTTGTLLDERNNQRFFEGVLDSSKQNLLNRLFSIRAGSVLGNTTPPENYFYLSGLLIGTELLSVRGQPYDRVVLCSNGTLQPLYQLAFATLSIPNVVVSPLSIDEATINGQALLYRKHFKPEKHVLLEAI